MRRLPPLGAMRVFEAAARRLSFKDAADELHVTPTAVSHQIRLLEEHLAVRLFERGTRQVALTAAGHQLFPVLRDGLDSFERAVERVRRTQGQAQAATLSSTVAFMAKVLAPRVGSFSAQHPGWSLRLDASHRVVDLDTEADAAIRYGSGRYAGLVVEPLFQDRFAPVCTPALAVAARRDLGAVPLIHFEWGQAPRDESLAPVWRTWLARAGLGGDAPPDAGLSFTEEMHAVQATVAGQGVGLLSLTLVADELRSGVLVQPFELAVDSYRYDLVYSPRAADRPATRVLREWVHGQFGNRA
ncbi:LysR substrate-binding domain-containing protein [Acidovorax sp. CF316]|uniref:LysR substrate-binding domain-containing protein n=1 Tax=Acidovorax sp. CF316 TaxID=1144317 RepID=UPI000553D3F7|nr:LysR substrate-binding domain-containing protein [Acidovorax sp. CF316]